jgi:hypothetical protein
MAAGCTITCLAFLGFFGSLVLRNWLLAMADLLSKRWESRADLLAPSDDSPPEPRQQKKPN